MIVEARDRVLLDGSDPDEKNFNSAIITSVGENGIGQGEIFALPQVYFL